jgi:hypothetical protein
MSLPVSEDTQSILVLTLLHWLPMKELVELGRVKVLVLLGLSKNQSLLEE